MQVKELIKAYLVYGKRDRIAVLTVVSMILVIYLYPYLRFSKNEEFPAKATSVLIKAIDTLAIKEGASNYKKNYTPTINGRQAAIEGESFTRGDLFQFDPNTLSIEGWQKLGLNEKTSKTIEKYRSKGGKFHHAEDIMKIWGLPNKFYERVKNYIFIAPTPNNYQQNNAGKTLYTKFEKKPLVVNVNEADTSAFIALPGIGNKLASRIVNFRDKLGGFYSVEQVGETYGLPDSTFQKIKGSLQLGGTVKTLNVNTATKEQLKIHPYIKWNLANAIVEYRNQHGTFKSLNELKNISIIDDATFEKIVHYLSL